MDGITIGGGASDMLAIVENIGGLHFSRDIRLVVVVKSDDDKLMEILRPAMTFKLKRIWGRTIDYTVPTIVGVVHDS